MALGLASFLLVFTGFWHATEWLMGGRTRDTLRLIPVGIVYAVLGWMIALGVGGATVAAIAGLAAAIGGVAAFTLRKTAQMRGWVTWAFIVIDAGIVLSVIAGLMA